MRRQRRTAQRSEASRRPDHVDATPCARLPLPRRRCGTHGADSWDEVSGQVGAELGEVAPEARVTHRNGYRPRPWETRVGEIELLIPRTRHGSYFPSFLEPRRRSEHAIVAVVLEAYFI